MRFVIYKYPRISAWIVFLGGLTIIILTDYYMRMSDGKIRDGGVPDAIACGAMLILGCLVVCLLWRAAKKYKHRVLEIFEIIGHIAIGYAILFIILLYYTLATGIDSL